MIRRLTTDEVAAATRHHRVTIILALQSGKLHGTQAKKYGTWSIREDCAEAWADGVPCVHQTPVSNVTPLRRRVA